MTSGTPQERKDGPVFPRWMAWAMWVLCSVTLIVAMIRRDMALSRHSVVMVWVTACYIEITRSKS